MLTAEMVTGLTDYEFHQLRIHLLEVEIAAREGLLKLLSSVKRDLAAARTALAN